MINWQSFKAHLDDIYIKNEKGFYVLDILSLDLDIMRDVKEFFDSNQRIIIEFYDINNDYNKVYVSNALDLLYYCNLNNKLKKVYIETILFYKA